MVVKKEFNNKAVALVATALCAVVVALPSFADV